jgi:hypothetical protein
MTAAVTAYGLDARAVDATLDTATVVTSATAGVVERNAAALFAQRLYEKTGLPVEVVPEGAGGGRNRTATERERSSMRGLVVLLGVPANAGRLRAFLVERHIPLPTPADPGPEGYLIKSVSTPDGVLIAAAAVDQRGTLYAVGELLRQAVVRPKGLAFPVDLDLRTAPAFRIRGTEVSQGGTMRELTRVRPWTEQEWRRVVLDYALAGANTFGGGANEFAFLKSYGLMVHGLVQPNNVSGHSEWAAVEPIGRSNYVCLSIPEARRAALENVERVMKHSLPYDIMRIPSGDPGGCWCEKCEPWGKTYVLMCADMAKVILKYLPHTRIYITNQELSNAGDQFIFDYLNQAPQTWMAGIYYGPGSNAMSWNGTKRPDHRLDLFEYPGFGILDGYLREMVRQMPKRQAIQMFTDLTHWTTSQYGMMVSDPLPDFEGRMPPPLDHWFYELRPDPAFAKTYNRRAFFVRPRAYYRIFQETMRYGEGEITYSEGHHDQFNQWIWQRLLWHPKVSLEDVIKEYACTWFGPEAAPAMSEAILQMERNLTEPLAGNDGISRAYRLVMKAGERMPARVREQSYLWAEYREKAVLDRYVQLRLLRQTERRRDIEKHFASEDVNGAAQYAIERLGEPQDSAEMAALSEEARAAGEASARLFGLRNIVSFTKDQDLVGLGWIERQVKRLAAARPEEKRAIARLIAHYDDPGEGGFYDDAGDPARSPHMEHGREYSVNNFLAGSLSNANLPSQRTMAYTEDAGPGVTFRYTGLDKAARYRVRFAFVRPKFLPRYAMLHTEKTQSIYANDRLLAADVEVPELDAQLFEYEIPPDLTAGGVVTIRLEKAANIAIGRVPLVNQWKRTSGWATIVSDVWLLKGATQAPSH